MWPYRFLSCQQICTISATDKHELRAQAAVEAAPDTVPTVLTLQDGFATAVFSACSQTTHREVGHLLFRVARLAQNQFLSSAM